MRNYTTSRSNLIKCAQQALSLTLFTREETQLVPKDPCGALRQLKYYQLLYDE